MTANSNYWIQLHTLPRRDAAPLTRAVVYQGHPGTPIAQTAAYERNGGTGIAAAMRDAQAIIDGRRAAAWFDACQFAQAANDLPKATPQPTVLTVDDKESRPPMVKDYLSAYTTMIVVAGMVTALLMKAC
jgi:hypothetical protein